MAEALIAAARASAHRPFPIVQSMRVPSVRTRVAREVPDGAPTGLGGGGGTSRGTGEGGGTSRGARTGRGGTGAGGALGGAALGMGGGAAAWGEPVPSPSARIAAAAR